MKKKIRFTSFIAFLFLFSKLTFSQNICEIVNKLLENEIIKKELNLDNKINPVTLVDMHSYFENCYPIDNKGRKIEILDTIPLRNDPAQTLIIMDKLIEAKRIIKLYIWYKSIGRYGLVKFKRSNLKVLKVQMGDLCF